MQQFLRTHYDKIMDVWLLSGLVYGGTIIINGVWYRGFRNISTFGFMVVLVMGCIVMCISVIAIAAATDRILRKKQGED